MLPKTNRLTKEKDFKNVLKKGRASYIGNLGLKAIPNNLLINRYGFLVGTRVSKKAVIRNKIKRQIREAIRLQAEKVKTGYDFAIIAQPGVINDKYEDIEKQINENFKKLRLYK